MLDGIIPPALGRLRRLEVLRLSGNELTGPIPSSLGQLSMLCELDLGQNRLTGRIPPALGQLSNLYLLRLSHNQLSGSIPPELGSLAEMDMLELSDNRLEGALPSEMCNLTKLVSMSLANNRLTGKIPPDLGKLPILTMFDLSGNLFAGEIPSELGWPCPRIPGGARIGGSGRWDSIREEGRPPGASLLLCWPEADPFHQYHQREEGEGGHAARAPGLADEAVEPFEAEAAEPAGRARGDAGDEVEGAADAEGDGDRQLVPALVDPDVLAGMAVGDEEQVGAGRGEALADLRPVGLGGRAGIGAGDGQAGVEAGQLGGGAFGHTGRGAEEVDAPPLLRGPLAETVDAVGAGDALGQGDPGEARGPEDADTVRRTQVGCGQNLCEGGLATRGHDKFRVDGADLAGAGRGVSPSLVPRSRLRDPGADGVKGLVEIDAIDAHAQNLQRRPSLLPRRAHFLAAASSSTASVSRAAFSQEKRLTFS